MQVDVRSDVREFIVDNFLFREDRETVSDTESLLENGLMDSTGVLELVAFLESDIGIEIQDNEIVPENFDSIENISNYANAKLSKNSN
ncbi:acyl carrier protein [Hoeflea poritis]|uniref:Acyl carrier protein n=1 Tax=Hoeflea poritis TaxID=2993659 RepID=A0ABT4VJN2_9HYPH|nr:acyl carrier protein [Hoeflea poritis]MDA4844917.1 acyl carrier protein [Hoeflea poritis]